MGLDDLVDQKENEHKKKEVEEKAGELGIDSLEELDQFSDSVQTLRRIVVVHDAKLEELERLRRDVNDLEEQVEEMERKIEIVAEKIKDAD